MKITIITASYNYENYIKETIQSILNQTYNNWELIIVDDGSKDNSISIINDYVKKDEWIKLYTHENNSNKGLSETIKLALSKTQTEWVMFLEADDTIAPDYIEQKIKIIEENENVNFIFNDINILYEDETLIPIYEKYLSQLREQVKKIGVPFKLIDLFRNKNCRCFVPTFSCVMLKKELFPTGESNTFKPPVGAWLDCWLYLQMVDKANCYFINKKLTNWRRHSESYINKPHQELKVISFLINEYKLLHFYPPILKRILKYSRRYFIKTKPREKEVILFDRFRFVNGVYQPNK